MIELYVNIYVYTNVCIYKYQPFLYLVVFCHFNQLNHISQLDYII